MRQPHRQHWDIFCKIVDNFGDIGVCWRLSQQLAKEHSLAVRLFIDDFITAQKIIPDLDSALHTQTIQGVVITSWPSLNTTPADVVIGAFSCELPDSYLQQMVRQLSIWINLEYLSAETWVGDFHAKPSPQPTLAITKQYFFPGFKDDTGGLIRERHLIAERDVFLASKTQQTAFWQALDISKPIEELENSIKISLFCYPQANRRALLSTLEASKQAIDLFTPLNSTTIDDILIDFAAETERTLRKGNVTVHLLPFLSQSHYDHLLWACDLNFVRGEDSWIRAIWAGKPFVWQPYIQTEQTHIKKMQAFLAMYTSATNDEIKSILVDAHLSWSNAQRTDTTALTRLIKNLSSLFAYSQQQTNALACQPDLATKLVFFSENLPKIKV